MRAADAARVLTKIAAYDSRTIGEADVMAWAEVLGDVAVADALEAVARHFAVSRDRVMPVDVIEHAGEIRAEREAEERRERYEQMRAITPEPAPAVTTDRSAELIALLRQRLPQGRPDKLRGPAWRAKNPGIRPSSTEDGA